jgi:hypothetical protein
MLAFITQGTRSGATRASRRDSTTGMDCMPYLEHIYLTSRPTDRPNSDLTTCRHRFCANPYLATLFEIISTISAHNYLISLSLSV